MTFKSWLASSSCGSAALFAAFSATAQQAAPSAQNTDDQANPTRVEEVVVTGSRVVTNGYQAPTPVTVVAAEDLKNVSPNLSDAIRQLPQLTGSNGASTPSFSPSAAGPSTSDTANLRNLGVTRTLVLLDGRRPPASGVTGMADMSLFPMQLVKRVDIVTGGASAAYGSDAVSGVVNFVLDTDFRGASIDMRSGISDYGDAFSYGAQASYGTGFAQDRGSFLISANYSGSDMVDGFDRPYSTRYWAAVPNPDANVAGQPQRLLRENANLSAATFGGLIITPGALRDVQFDANGAPIPYVHGTLNTGTVEVGGQGAHYPQILAAETKQRSVFSHVNYEVNDRLSVFLEGSYGRGVTAYPNLAPYYLTTGAFTVRQDNAFLPTVVRDAMVSNGLQSVQVGKIDMTWGRQVVTSTADTLNLVAGFEAEIGRFTLDGYYSHGETDLSIIQSNNRITARARNAADAVFSNGRIVCRSTLTNPNDGCVPWNPLGTQPLTDAQRAYQGGPGQSEAFSTAKQDVFALNLRGDLFQNWAGTVAGAVGLEYRDLSGSIQTDPIAQAIGWANGNIQPSSGGYDVKEVFGEVAMPLYRGDAFLRSLDLNAAIRRTEYSTSGGVTTWKLGLTSEIAGGLRLRGTVSRDIRAPNIGDLYGPRTRSITSIIDPVNNNQTYSNIFTWSGSNPDLKPEEADTLTAGVSYRPEWLSGFGASIDYYKIEIVDAIATISFQQIVDQCQAGNAALCSLIERDSNRIITQIVGTGQNVDQINVSGVDFDLSYRTDFAGGRLSLRGIATYLDNYEYIALGAKPIQQAGAGSFPHWRGNLQATWSHGATTISLQERFVGVHDRVLPPTTIDQNRVAETFYTNLTVRHQLDLNGSAASPELYLTVANLFNQEPRVGATNSLGLGTASQFDGALYDLVGRTYTVGARLSF